jgi:hypothetical protein
MTPFRHQLWVALLDGQLMGLTCCQTSKKLANSLLLWESASTLVCIKEALHLGHHSKTKTLSVRGLKHSYISGFDNTIDSSASWGFKGH